MQKNLCNVLNFKYLILSHFFLKSVTKKKCDRKSVTF